MPGTPDCTAVPILRKDAEPAVAYECDKDKAARALYEDVAGATGRVSQRGRTGSGFFVKDGSQFVTNAHVVNGSAGLMLIEAGNGDMYRARIEKMDDLHDLAVLRLEDGEKHGQALKIGTSIKLKPGEPLYAVGHPQGADFTFLSPGKFIGQSSYRQAVGIPLSVTESANWAEYNNARRVQMEVNIQHGNSGGPVVDKNESVVGVATNLGMPGSEGHSGYAVPSEYVQKLLRDDDRGRYQFDYEKVSFMHENLGVGLVSSGVVTGLALKFNRVGAGVFALADMVDTPRNMSLLLHGNRDQRIQAGLGLGETAAITAGSILGFMGRRGLSYGAIATSCAFGLASMFQPTEVRLKDVYRNDGSDGLPLLWNE